MGRTLKELKSVLKVQSKRRSSRDIKSFERAGLKFNTMVKEGRISPRGNQLKASTEKHTKSAAIFQK